jgi:hypothetical protein
MVDGVSYKGLNRNCGICMCNYCKKNCHCTICIGVVIQRDCHQSTLGYFKKRMFQARVNEYYKRKAKANYNRDTKGRSQ